MKEQDVRIGMKVVPHDKTAGQKGLKNSTVWEAAKDDCLNYLYVKRKHEGAFILNNKENYGIAELFNACDFEPYIDIQEAADALNRAFNNLTETLTNTLQPLIDALSRPEVAKALEALGKDKENLREEISKAFEEFCVSGTPYSSFTIFEAGYRAGMKRGDK